MIGIRPAEPDERAAAADIAVAAFAQLGALLAPDQRELLYQRVRATTTDPGPGTVIVAVADGSVVGSVVYNGPAAGQHPLFGADWAFFRSIGVDAAWGGQGIGRRLVEACIARARRDGAAWLGLYAADPNTVAIGLYRSMGFRETGPAPSYWGVTYRVYGYDLSAG